ncbi:MAG: hypothetical protein R2867_26315 [Caldilineaceae bacterium]
MVNGIPAACTAARAAHTRRRYAGTKEINDRAIQIQNDEINRVG